MRLEYFVLKSLYSLINCSIRSRDKSELIFNFIFPTHREYYTHSVTLIRAYNLNNTYTASFLETRASIVKLGSKDRQKHLQRCRNMCDGASAVEMLSALPYQGVEGRERCRERREGNEERAGRKGKWARRAERRERGVGNTFRFLPSPWSHLLPVYEGTHESFGTLALGVILRNSAMYVL